MAIRAPAGGLKPLGSTAGEKGEIAMIPALTNHLRQSTLFAAAGALLTLALRNNRAQTRHWVWMTASMKFLLPFTVLVAIGGHFSWRKAPATAPPPLAVVEEISQPFAAPIAAPVCMSASTPRA